LTKEITDTQSTSVTIRRDLIYLIKPDKYITASVFVLG